MSLSDRRRSHFAILKIAAALSLIVGAPSYSMTYYLVDGGASWPGDIRARIIQSMDEAVAIYNANSAFNVNVRVNYNAGIPTAQSNYNGEIGFGGSISARVAMHEISHYLGTGTTGEWNAQFNNGIWVGAAARHFMKLYDGPGGELRLSGQHYYPYGLNYDNEDSPQNRIREVKLILGMRFDMGGNDADADGMSDEWERMKAGTTALSAASDFDGDGISNYDEWWTEGDPMRAAPVKHGHTYVIRARHSQKVMEVAGGNLANGGNVVQNALAGTPSQKWTADYRGGGYWRFINLGSGKVLEVENVSSAAGANIRQWEWLNNDGQQWRLVPDGAASWKIFNKASMNMVVDVDGGIGATGDGTNISQYFDVLGGTNQDWAFDDVTPGEVPGRLVAEYKLEGNGRDNSGHELHGVTTGGISYTAGRVDGQAATFNGTNGSVEIPASVEVDFTIACWVKTTATAGGAQWFNGMGLVDGEVGGANADFGLALVGTKAAFGLGNPDTTITSSVSINDGAWHHLTATLATGTGAMKLYVDGVLQASATGPIGARTAPAKLRLGSIGGAFGFLNGSLDEVRLYNTILGASEIARLATVGNTLVASYSFDGNTLDSSQHRNHGDAVAVTFPAGKIGGNAAQFDGTGSFVKIPAAVTADFSISYWVKTTATGGFGQWYAGRSMVDADIPGVANDWGISLTGDRVSFGMGDAGAGFTIRSTTPINDGVWHHVAATRVCSTGAMKLYVDGALQASGVGSTAVRNAPGGIRLGSTLFGGTYFSGAIDELRIYNYALENSQVAALAAPLPGPWIASNIGNPGSDGYAGYSAASGGVFTVVGGGTDIGGSSDQFHLVAAPSSDDQIAVTRVLSTPVDLSGMPAANGRAGLMFRDSAAANAPFAHVVFEGSAGLRFQYRGAIGGSVAQVGGSVQVAAPVWLRLARRSSTFTASYATTADAPASGDWTSLGSAEVPLTVSPLIGLAVASRNPAQVVTAMFGNLAVTAAPGTIWRQLHFSASANAGNAADGADPDRDGLTNLLERALSLDPNVGDPGEDRSQVGKDSNFLRFTYSRSRAATDLHFQIVWSSDLLTWSEAGVTDTVLSTTPTIELHEARVPLSTFELGHGFLRLQVSP